MNGKYTIPISFSYLLLSNIHIFRPPQIFFTVTPRKIPLPRSIIFDNKTTTAMELSEPSQILHSSNSSTPTPTPTSSTTINDSSTSNVSSQSNMDDSSCFAPSSSTLE